MRGADTVETLGKPAWLQAIDDFFYKPAFFFLVAALTVVANVLGAEFFTYTVFVGIAVYLCLFGRDLLPIMPMAVCCYIAPSRDNNPALNDGTIFSRQGGGSYIMALAVILVLALIYRLIRDPELGRTAFFKCKRKLIWGMVALCAGYFLSGIGSGQFAEVWQQNLLFAAFQGLPIIGFYCIFTALVKWDKAPADYLAWTGMCIGYVILGEIVNICIRYNIIQDGSIVRDDFFTGWGGSNNMGTLLAMMIPFCFYLADKRKHNSVFFLSGLLFLAGVFFTCSRGAILFGVVAYLASYMISLIHSHNARANAAIHIITVAAGILVLQLYPETIRHLFHNLLQRKLDPSGRDELYIAGWQQFLNAPLFGSTFFPVDYPPHIWSYPETFDSLCPPLWHNTVIQLLASCGIVGLAAYSFHRFQTLHLFFRRPTGEKMFAFVSVLTLLLASLLDCHFFNIGPTLFYSMALAFVEKRLDS